MVKPRLGEDFIALRAVREFQEGWVVNLGAGLPIRCNHYLPTDREILLQSENGLIGHGPILTNPADVDPTRVNAGIQPVAYRPGMAVVDLAESFAMIRGGHIDVTVLGALQVSEKGDLANNTLPGKQVGSFGGGQDLAFNAKRVIVCMTHTARDGQPKIMKQCTLPLTAPEVVDLIITDLSVIEVTPQGLVLKEIAAGWTPEEVQALTEPALIISPDLQVMEV